MRLGEKQMLTVVKKVDFGVYLGNEEQRVLLPKKQVPEGVASRLLKRPASCKEWAEEEVLEQADLVIAVGYDIVELAPVKWNWDGNRRILHIDSRPAHVNKLYQPDTEVAGGRFISGKAPEAFI